MAVVVLDAGVVIAVLDRDDAHHEAALREVRRLLTLRDDLVLPVSSYAELLVAPWDRGEEAVVLVDDLLDRLPVRVEPATRAVAKRASALRARHGARLRLPDALVVATAIELGARVLTTGRGWPPLEVAVDLVGRPHGRRSPGRPR